MKTIKESGRFWDSFQILTQNNPKGQRSLDVNVTYQLLWKSVSFVGHLIPSGPHMDGKVSDFDKNLECYVYKCKK